MRKKEERERFKREEVKWKEEERKKLAVARGEVKTPNHSKQGESMEIEKGALGPGQE